MNRILYLLLLAGLAVSCNMAPDKKPLDGVKFKKASYKNDFYVMVPEFTTSTTKLHEDANIQYNNVLKEFYVIVINESKTELQNVIDENEIMLDYFPTGKANAASYYQFVINGLKERGEKIQLSDSSIIKDHHGIQLRAVTAQGMLNNQHKVFYRLGIAEGKENFYQVFTWTLDKYKDKYKPVMDSIINSLKEY